MRKKKENGRENDKYRRFLTISSLTPLNSLEQRSIKHTYQQTLPVLAEKFDYPLTTFQQDRSKIDCKF